MKRRSIQDHNDFHISLLSRNCRNNFASHCALNVARDDGINIPGCHDGVNFYKTFVNCDSRHEVASRVISLKGILYYPTERVSLTAINIEPTRNVFIATANIILCQPSHN